MQSRLCVIRASGASRAAIRPGTDNCPIVPDEVPFPEIRCAAAATLGIGGTSDMQRLRSLCGYTNVDDLFDRQGIPGLNGG